MAQAGGMEESLDHHDIALVQHSLAMLRRELPPDDTQFYDRLFRRNPEFRSMFRDDIAGQGMRFMTTLAVITDALTTPSVFDAEISRLAEGHAAIPATSITLIPSSIPVTVLFSLFYLAHEQVAGFARKVFGEFV